MKEEVKVMISEEEITEKVKEIAAQIMRTKKYFCFVS